MNKQLTAEELKPFLTSYLTYLKLTNGDISPDIEAKLISDRLMEEVYCAFPNERQRQLDIAVELIIANS